MGVNAASRLKAAVNEFNSGNYFEAHELLEDIWYDVHDETKQLYQGLLHYATALHHLTEKNNPKGALLQIDKALKRLDANISAFNGIDLIKLSKDIQKLRLKIIKKEALKRLPVIKTV